MFFKGKIFRFFLQMIYPVIFIIGYYITNLFVCMGQFRIYTIIGILFGYILCYITFYKILDKNSFLNGNKNIFRITFNDFFKAESIVKHGN